MTGAAQLWVQVVTLMLLQAMAELLLTVDQLVHLTLVQVLVLVLIMVPALITDHQTITVMDHLAQVLPIHATATTTIKTVTAATTTIQKTCGNGRKTVCPVPGTI